MTSPRFTLSQCPSWYCPHAREHSRPCFMCNTQLNSHTDWCSALNIPSPICGVYVLTQSHPYHGLVISSSNRLLCSRGCMGQSFWGQQMFFVTFLWRKSYGSDARVSASVPLFNDDAMALHPLVILHLHLGHKKPLSLCAGQNHI